MSLLIIGIPLFFSLRFPQVPSFLSNVFSYTAYPFLILQNAAVYPIKTYFQKKQSIATLQKEVERLRKEKKELLNELIEMHSTVWFFQTTNELIDYKMHHYQSEAQLAQIIYRHISFDEHFYLINRGSHHGVVPDMVAVYKNCLVGRIGRVYPYYSKVILITDKNCKVASHAVKSKVNGISEGILDKNILKLNYVNHLNTIQHNDIVLSSGEGLIFPKGYGLGTIKKYHIDGLFYDIEIEPFLTWNDLDYCYVMQKDS